MGRAIELSGDRLRLLFYAVQLSVLVLALFFVVPRVGGSDGLLLAGLFAALLIAMAIGLWRRANGDEGTHLGTADDITYDPFADPGQAARDRWEKSGSQSLRPGR